MFMLSDNIFFSLLRTQSVILISSDDEVLFYERTMEGANWLENKYEFNIESVGWILNYRFQFMWLVHNIYA